MTIVCACIDQEDNAVWMGADESISNKDEMHLAHNAKMFKKDGFLIGYAGPCLFAQHINYLFTPPPVITNGPDLTEYMVRFFVPRMKSVLEENGYKEPDLNKDGGEFELLVGYKNRLFMLGCDLSVVEYKEQFAAVGSGALYALGAMEVASTHPHNDAALVVSWGLSAAAKFDSHCVMERSMLSTKGDQDGLGGQPSA